MKFYIAIPRNPKLGAPIYNPRKRRQFGRSRRREVFLEEKSSGPKPAGEEEDWGSVHVHPVSGSLGPFLLMMPLVLS